MVVPSDALMQRARRWAKLLMKAVASFAGAKVTAFCMAYSVFG
jgi:hypothetical protein